MGSPFGRYAGAPTDASVTVVLQDAPLRVWQRATEHHDELMREMALLALSDPPPELPERLLELVDVLGNRYGAAGSRPDEEKDAAVAAGRDRVTLTYEITPDQAAQAAGMRALLDEAEAFCATHLLTMQQPETEARFSRWYIDQFVQQAAGAAPEPWSGPWD